MSYLLAGKLAHCSFRATCNLCSLKLQPLGKHSKLSGAYINLLSLPLQKAILLAENAGRKFVNMLPRNLPPSILRMLCCFSKQR